MALIRELKALSHCHLPCRDPVGTSRCVDQKDTHTSQSAQHPTYLNTSTHTLHGYHPLISTKRSMGMVYAPLSISVCPGIHSNCFQMQRKPLLVFLPLEFAVFLPIVLCLLSKRSYSRGAKEPPHLPLWTSCTLIWQVTPIHRLHRSVDIQDVKCQEAAASNSLRNKPQIWILQRVTRPSKPKATAQHTGLLLSSSPSFSFRKKLPLSATFSPFPLLALMSGSCAPFTGRNRSRGALPCSQPHPANHSCCWTNVLVPSP